MDRIDMLTQLMYTLDEITEATAIALDTLNENAKMTRQLMNEIINGAESFSKTDKENTINKLIDLTKKEEDSDEPYIGDGEEEIEELANKIVSEIKEKGYDQSGIYGIKIMFDPEKINPDTLTELVEMKLKEDARNTEEDIDEEINFTNPFDKE